MKYASNRKQIPGQLWVFTNKKTGEAVSGILPDNFGESNDFVIWKPYSGKRCKSGSWMCKKFSEDCTRRHFEGRTKGGLQTRFRILLRIGIRNSIAKNITPPNTTGALMAEMWDSQKGLCVACRGELDILNSNFDHDHQTGEPRVFVHRHCNSAEGYLNKMSDEQFDSFVDFIKDIRSKYAESGRSTGNSG